MASVFYELGMLMNSIEHSSLPWR